MGQKPSIRLLVGSCVAVMLTTAACGTASPAGTTVAADGAATSAAATTTAATAPAPTTAAALPDSQEALRAALLTTADLPPGFTTDPSVSAGTSGGMGQIESGPGCGPLMAIFNGDMLKQTKGELVAEASFVHNTTGTHVNESLNLAPDEAAIRAQFATWANAATACHRFTVTDGGAKATYQVATEAVPNVGDERIGVHLTGTVTGLSVPISAHLLTVRRAGLVVSLSITDSPLGHGGKPEVDAQALMRTAYGKVVP